MTAPPRFHVKRLPMSGFDPMHWLKAGEKRSVEVLLGPSQNRHCQKDQWAFRIIGVVLDKQSGPPCSSVVAPKEVPGPEARSFRPGRYGPSHVV